MVAKLIIIYSMFALLENVSIHKPVPFIVEGIVKDKQTGDPIFGVHVFTIKGEEEGITNEKGEFKFETWKHSGKLEIQKTGYLNSIMKLTFPVKKITILLEKE